MEFFCFNLRSLWWVDIDWVPTKPSSFSRMGRGEIRWKETLVDQNKGSLAKQKQRPCVEAKKNRRFILYFPSAGDVYPLPRKEWFLRKANVLVMNALLFQSVV